MADKTNKELVLDATCDLVSDFLYYCRRDDENLPRNAIQKIVADGEVTVDEIIEKFSTTLRKFL